MFERYLADALATHFGHIVDNLDHHNIALSAWRGGLVLRNVALRSNALDHFIDECPLEIAYSKVGRLDVRIPWALLRSYLFRGSSTFDTNSDLSVSLVLSDVDILIIPKKRRKARDDHTGIDSNETMTSRNPPDEGEYTASSTRNTSTSSRSAKQSSTASLPQHEKDTIRERNVQAALDASLLLRLSNDNLSTPFQDRTKNILTNLSVTVKNIHVRYEDGGDCLGFRQNQDQGFRPPFAIGLTLREFSVANGGKKAKTKIASATALAMYWDSDVHIMSSANNDDDPDLYKECFETTLPQLRHEFLLDPLSASVTLALGSKGNYNTVDVELPSCRLFVFRSLLEDMGYLRKSVSLWMNEREGLVIASDTLARLTRLRPTERPILNPTGWWKFAMAAVMTVNAKKRNPVYDRNGRFDPDSDIPHRNKGWVGFVDAYRRRRRYHELFRAFLGADHLFHDVYDQNREQLHEEMVAFERQLLVSEIAAFRLSVAERYNVEKEDFTQQLLGRFIIVPTVSAEDSQADDNRKETDDSSERKLVFAPESTSEQRFKSFAQVLSTLKAEQKAIAPPELKAMTVNGLATTWKTSIRCLEFSIQVNDSQSQQPWSKHRSSGFLSSPSPSTPVIRISCAFCQEQDICRNGSWRLTSQVGSLVVNDCSVDRNEKMHTNLLGPKSYGRDEWNDEDTFQLDGKTFQKTVWVHVERTNTYESDGTPLGSSTRTLARVLPLELVYVSRPIETLSHVGETFNDDFADDYHRLSHSLTNWKERQKRRLLMALAHKHKKLYIDVIIGAPVILVPESSTAEGQLLVVDLGQLRFSDDSSIPESSASTFDDKWKLQIKSVQVQRLIGRWRQRDSTGQQLVEPFSLDVAFWTRVSGDSQDDSSALIQATLPRLKLNISSSALHMFRLLQAQWEYLKDARESLSPSVAPTIPPEEQPGTVVKAGKRSLEMQFNAPLLDIHLEHDYESVNVLDLSLKGISGRFEQTRGQDFHSNHFTAKVHTLVVVDTFGNPKHDYSLLVSSVPTSIGVPGGTTPDSTFFDTTRQGADLVSINFDSRRSSPGRQADELDVADKLAIRFHELFVNWNPETLALIMRALSGNPGSRLQEPDEDFFDAVEDKFYDAIDPLRPSSPTRSLFSDILSPSAYDNDASNIPNFRRLEIVFTMSRLRLNFNRDDRNRQVFSAEMFQTTVRHTKMTNGGSRTLSTIGNLTLSDLSISTTGTLYRDILGLKTSGDEKSLVAIELICNPKARQFKSLSGIADDPVVEVGKPVSVDEESGRVHGFDYYMNARFSPMRFVYIQQALFEIVDYFFSGIIGSEIWGPGDIESQSDLSILEGRSIDAGKVSFTRFDIELESPVILVPVHSCSTDYLQIDVSRISMKNRYSYDRIRPDDLSFKGDGGNRQWYNTCCVEIHRIRAINGASRSALSPEENMPTAILRLNWPTGPCAFLNMPKWKVSCDVGALAVRLEQSDYALLQNLVQYNLGENSRHMKEWDYYLSLSSHGKAIYLGKSAVHFGYDQKDARLSTFICDVCFDGPQIKFVNRGGGQIAALKSNRVYWNYKRLEDRISHQTISCDPLLNAPDGTIIFFVDPNRRVPSRQLHHGLVYVSSTEPSGSNAKVISAVAPILTYPSETWFALVDFFNDVVVPNYLAPNEAIQVGDRWYRIGEESSTTRRPSVFQSIGPKREGVDLANYTLNVNLTSPIVNIGSYCDVSMLSSAVHYRYVRKAGLTAQFIKIADVSFGSIGVVPLKMPAKVADEEDEVEINSEFDASLVIDVSSVEILLSPRLVTCLSGVTSSLKTYSKSRVKGDAASLDWDADSETGTEATADSAMSLNNSSLQAMDLSIRRLQTKIVNDRNGEVVSVCSLLLEDASISRRQQVTPDDNERVLSQTISIICRSVEVCSQDDDPVLSIRSLNENFAVEISLVDRIIERDQQMEIYLMKTLADFKPDAIRMMIETGLVYSKMLSEGSNSVNAGSTVGRPITKSFHACIRELSLSLYDGANDIALFEVVGRQCLMDMKESVALGLTIGLSIRELSIFGVSSNLIHRQGSAHSDLTDFLLIQYGRFVPASNHDGYRQYPSWMVFELVKNDEGKSMLSSKVAPCKVTLVPDSVSNIVKLIDDWIRELGLQSPVTKEPDDHRLAMLIDIDMSKTAVDVLSDPENGLVVTFGEFYAVQLSPVAHKFR